MATSDTTIEFVENRHFDDDDVTDWGREKNSHETDAGFNRYVVTSVMQKAVRRNQEEIAAWCGFELARSGYGWNLWKRLILYIFEDLKAGQNVACELRNLEKIAKFEYDMDSDVGIRAGIRGAVLAARAEPSREAVYINGYHDRLAKERHASEVEGEDVDYWPVVEKDEIDDIVEEEGYEYGDVIADETKQATLTGSSLDEDDDDVDDNAVNGGGNYNDLDEPLRSNETYGGYHIEAVVDILHESVHSWNKDEEIKWESRATWAAWELIRSKFKDRLWHEICGLATAMSSNLVTLIKEYESIAMNEYDGERWPEHIVAMHATLTLCREESFDNEADSIRASEYKNRFEKIARKRGKQIENDEKPDVHFPVRKKHLKEGGKLDVCLDKHTREGKKLGRGWRHFRTHAGRVAGGERALSEKARVISLRLDDKGYRAFEVDFTEAEVQHSVSAIDEQNPFYEPDIS